LRGKEIRLMEVSRLKNSIEWFRVHSLRKIEDPGGKIDRRELVVALDQYPHDFGLGPNPRRPDPKSRVAKDIRSTLEENGDNFHLLNRGITVLAKGVEYDSKTERVRLHLHESEEEESHYGILDGGNTNAQINEWRRTLPDDPSPEELKRRFVNVQVMVPRTPVLTSDVEDLLNDIKEARNNSVQVKQKSLADARHHFDILKQVLSGEPYFNEISWREGDKGGIDVLQIVTLLMLVFPPFSEDAPDREPNGAYGRKEKCLEYFLNYSDIRGEELERWLYVVPTLLRLFDEMQVSFPGYLGGRFGKIAEVRIYDERLYEKGSKKYRKSPTKTQFLGRDMKYEYPTGWLYPLVSGFRILAGPSATGTVVWKKDPFEFWKQHGPEVCSRYEPHLKSVGYETKKIATSPITFSAMKGAITDLYKDDLLAEAGISA
jgi:hypothetical protein